MMPLVFVHGYLGGSAQWAGQIEALGSSFRVVTPDLPGFGNNANQSAPESIGEFADSVLTQLRDQGIERFHLVGHSMGGMIVQEMTARAPEAVDHLVLYGTGPVGNMPGRFETIEQSRQRLMDDGVPTTGARIASNWFVEGCHGRGYDTCAQLAALANPQAASAALTAMENWSGAGLLPTIQARTLVLWGDLDKSYRWEQPRQLWQAIPNAGLAVIPGCSHAVHLEKPDLFNAVLLDFFIHQGQRLKQAS